MPPEPKTHKRWTEDEEAKLLDLYPDKPNDELARLFSRPISSIVSKAHLLKIGKSDAQRTIAARANRAARESARNASS